MEQHQLNEIMFGFRQINEKLNKIIELLEKITENQPEKPRAVGPIISYRLPTRDEIHEE